LCTAPPLEARGEDEGRGEDEDEEQEVDHVVAAQVEFKSNL
jgi:hypothetical protein